MSKLRQKKRSLTMRVKQTVHDAFRGFGTLTKMNAQIGQTVEQRLQAEIARMTNWQRNQWNRYVTAHPQHRKELAIAQAFAGLDRKTREFHVGGLVVAHG